MNVNQRTALAELRRAVPDHEIEWSGRSDSRTVRIKCSCGWQWGTNERNALARASQIYGAEVQHLKASQADGEGKHG